MKKLIKNSNQKNRSALTNFAKLQLTKDQQRKVKGGGDGSDGSDVIIVEDVVIG